MDKYIVLLFIFIMFQEFAWSNELLIGHDEVIYNPIEFAIKDISFDVEIEGLAEEITKMKSYGTVGKIIFNVRINKLNKYEINIDGISSKFNDLNNNLKAKLIPYLELLFPKKLNNFYRGYELKKSGQKLTAIDKTSLKQIRESYMLFENNGILRENKIKTPQGTQIINFKYQTGAGGFRKLLLNEVSRKIIYGPSHLISNTKIDYDLTAEKPIPQILKTEFFFENKENNLNEDRVIKLDETYKITKFKFN